MQCSFSMYKFSNEIPVPQTQNISPQTEQTATRQKYFSCSFCYRISSQDYLDVEQSIPWTLLSVWKKWTKKHKHPQPYRKFFDLLQKWRAVILFLASEWLFLVGS
jgi:hypothetical protein